MWRVAYTYYTRMSLIYVLTVRRDPCYSPMPRPTIISVAHQIIFHRSVWLYSDHEMLGAWVQWPVLSFALALS